MSSPDSAIDPALRDLPPPTQTAGIKRKIRTANATSPLITPDRGRVTRRSAALLSAALQLHSTSPGDKAPSGPDIEPSRGEEENKYQWTPRDSAKRSRHRSPSSHATRSNDWAAPLTPTPNPLMAPQGTGPSSRSHSPSHGGIDNLAAAAAAATFQSGPNHHLPQPQLPYPFGLTPFRYPCLMPHQPQPPPGDPNNPAFVAFDPSEGSQVPPSATTSPSTASRRTSGGPLGSVQGSRPASRPSSRGREDHFASFSTLLAATEAHSTRHSSVAGSHAPSYYPTPERDIGPTR
ncbi:hypothetical protein CspeluHIS016_0900680 [Cutaneotrichosporon spelunceum]|uniref:Uncharacterized protein n=1 Tax=Cutaneotrichosporon spelunceum TaxID=1672016 RepID=A0AAD3U0A1_9TREE|nr:hypothetical protein CspeluHIS016_0900680 [Cutaneotrichosporon spelunceum]